jgi:type I restriction enzyme S subunit
MVDIEYLHRVLRHYDFSPYISGTTRAKLTQEQMNKARIRVPPLPLQRAFASQVAAVERLKASSRASLAKLNGLFVSLQHRAFRGEL